MRLPSLRALDTDIIAKGGLEAYHRLTWPLVESGQYRGNWHVGFLARHLEALYHGEIRQCVVNIPPGTGKSGMCNVSFPTWCWLQPAGALPSVGPQTRILHATYADTLVLRDARKRLSILSSNWWRTIAPAGARVVHTGPKPAASLYFSAAGGLHFATTRRGVGTGWHGHGRITDDPLSATECTTANLEDCIDWWDRAWTTRNVDADTSWDLLIMQRLHTRDLAGYVVDQAGRVERASDNSARTTVHLKIPMRFRAAEKCQTPWGEDPRTEEGELLHPDRYPERAVKQLEVNLGPLGAAAQFDQEPVPPGGNIVHVDWLRYYRQPDEAGTDPVRPVRFDRVIVSVDATFGDTRGSSLVCILVLGKVGADVYALDCVAKKMGFPETVDVIRAVAAQWTAHHVVIEDKANGHAAEETLRGQVPGLMLYSCKGSKTARLSAVSGFIRAGNLYLPRGATWLADYVTELTQFPFAPNDDRADATSQGLDFLLLDPSQRRLEQLAAAVRPRR